MTFRVDSADLAYRTTFRKCHKRTAPRRRGIARELSNGPSCETFRDTRCTCTARSSSAHACEIRSYLTWRKISRAQRSREAPRCVASSCVRPAFPNRKTRHHTLHTSMCWQCSGSVRVFSVGWLWPTKYHTWHTRMA